MVANIGKGSEGMVANMGEGSEGMVANMGKGSNEMVANMEVQEALGSHAWEVQRVGSQERVNF